MPHAKYLRVCLLHGMHRMHVLTVGCSPLEVVVVLTTGVLRGRFSRPWNGRSSRHPCRSLIGACQTQHWRRCSSNLRAALAQKAARNGCHRVPRLYVRDHSVSMRCSLECADPNNAPAHSVNSPRNSLPAWLVYAAGMQSVMFS